MHTLPCLFWLLVTQALLWFMAVPIPVSPRLCMAIFPLSIHVRIFCFTEGHQSFSKHVLCSSVEQEISELLAVKELIVWDLLDLMWLSQQGSARRDRRLYLWLCEFGAAKLSLVWSSTVVRRRIRVSDPWTQNEARTLSVLLIATSTAPDTTNLWHIT